MTDADHADLVFRISAIERLLTWMVAQEMRRSGDEHAALQRLTDELHALLDGANPPTPALRQMSEIVSARLDGLVQGVANELRRTEGHPRRPEAL